MRPPALSASPTRALILERARNRLAGRVKPVYSGSGAAGAAGGPVTAMPARPPNRRVVRSSKPGREEVLMAASLGGQNQKPMRGAIRLIGNGSRGASPATRE